MTRQLATALSSLLGRRGLSSARPPWEWLLKKNISTAAYSKGMSNISHIVFYASHLAYLCELERLVDLSDLRHLSHGIFPCYRDCRKLVSAVAEFEGSTRGLDHLSRLPSRKRSTKRLLVRLQESRKQSVEERFTAFKQIPAEKQGNPSSPVDHSPVVRLPTNEKRNFSNVLGREEYEDFSSDYYAIPTDSECPLPLKKGGGLFSDLSSLDDYDCSPTMQGDPCDSEESQA